MYILLYFRISANNVALLFASKKLAVKVANSSIKKTLEQQKERTCGAYTAYSSSTRAKSKICCRNGNKTAVAEFTKELKKPVNGSTVRSLITCYLNELKWTRNKYVSGLEHSNRGRSLHLGAIDCDVISYVKKLQVAGGIVNKSVIIAGATDIVELWKAEHSASKQRWHRSRKILG